MDRSALIIVDMQYDFLPGGSLPVAGGDHVIGTLNSYIEMFLASGNPIVATRDWHPVETTHFQAHGGVWPMHCVQGTHGAEFHADLRLPQSTIVISKGMGATQDAYSGFQGADPGGRSLTTVLRELGIERVCIGGVATDYCTVATTLSALAEGFKVSVLVDTIRGINLKPGDIENAIADMVRHGAEVTTIERLDATLHS